MGGRPGSTSAVFRPANTNENASAVRSLTAAVNISTDYLKTYRERFSKGMLTSDDRDLKDLLAAIRTRAKADGGSVPGTKTAKERVEVLMGVYSGAYPLKRRSRRPSKTKSPAGGGGPGLAGKIGDGGQPRASDEDRRSDPGAGGAREKAASGEDHHQDPHKEGKQTSAGDRRVDPVEPEPSPAPVEEDDVMATPKDTRPKKVVVAPVQTPVPEMIDLDDLYEDEITPVAAPKVQTVVPDLQQLTKIVRDEIAAALSQRDTQGSSGKGSRSKKRRRRDAVDQIVERAGGALKDKGDNSTTRSFATKEFSRTIKSATKESGKPSPEERGKRKRRRESSETEDDDDAGWGPEGLREFWKDRESRQWPAPVLGDAREGNQMLANPLRDHATYVAFANNLEMNTKRNKSEVVAIARALDSLFHTLGAKKARYDVTAEILVRRMAAVIIADKEGDWKVANKVEGGQPADLLSHKQRRRYQSELKTDKALAGTATKKNAAPDQHRKGGAGKK